MSFLKRRRNNRAKKVLIYLFLIITVGLGAFVSFSPIFEKNSPKISMNKEIFWNLKSPLKVNFFDDTEIKSYVVTYFDENNEITLDTNIINKNKGSIDLNILAPRLDRMYKPKNVRLKIEVFDTSKWNFFRGNQITKEIRVNVDRKKPIANVITNSYKLRQGGSAAVVVEVRDENLKDLYISFNNEERFELIPFYKKNYYMAIITWPIYFEDFERVNLVAVDAAKNKTIKKVPLYIKSHKTKIDKIKISDSFINKVSKNVLVKSGYDIPDDQVDIFTLSNTELRASNVKTIKDETKKNMNLEKVNRFKLKAFRQLRGSKTFANYGERRHYYYDGQHIDEAWHLGMDWASIKKAKIYTTNAGRVVFNDYLGLYGNTVIIDHKYGVATLYAHSSKISVDLDEKVRSGQYIANTGSTGAVFGDHLHFGVLVQGIEVNPKEWMDKYWIRENITKVINNAVKVIKSK